MIKRRNFFFYGLLFFVIASTASLAQEPVKARPSPLAIIAIRYKDAYVKITYAQPQKKGREIFGKLVPYDQVWRTGANEATELTITRNMQINGTLLKAGTYSIFTIPKKDNWTVIINSEVGLWGAYNYNSKLDVMKFDVPVSTSNTLYESFTMQFEHRNEIADLLFLWDKTRISIPLKFIN